MATCSRILAWRIPWTEEPGGCSSWGPTPAPSLCSAPQSGSVLMLTPHCLALCGLIIRPEIWLYFCNFVALLQSCFEYPRAFAFAINFRISLALSREACLDFGWDNTESTDESGGLAS